MMNHACAIYIYSLQEMMNMKRRETCWLGLICFQIWKFESWLSIHYEFTHNIPIYKKPPWAKISNLPARKIEQSCCKSSISESLLKPFIIDLVNHISQINIIIRYELCFNFYLFLVTLLFLRSSSIWKLY